MVKIFVSYSHNDDKTLVERLDYLLELTYGDGNVWYDKNMRGGKEWWEQILTQIGNCDVFVYFLSANSNASQYCRDEIEEARKMQKPIIVMQIDKSFPPPKEWESYQCDKLYDETNDISLEGLSRLNGAIFDNLHLQIPPQLTEAQKQADLVVLNKIWPSISGVQMDDLLTRFRFGMIPRELLDITIRSFMSLRRRPEYQFNNKSLQRSFEELYQTLANFDLLIRNTHYYEKELEAFNAINLKDEDVRHGIALVEATRKMIREVSMTIRAEIPEFTFQIE